MYGGSSEAPTVCPGEGSCEVWASTSGRNHAARERNACHPCPMFGTKTDGGKKNHKYFEGLVKRAFHVRNLQRSGYPALTSQITTSDFQVVIMLERMVEFEEIKLKRSTSELITAFLKARAM